MEIVYDDDGLERAMAALGAAGELAGSLAREGGLSAERPVLVDRFLEDASEVDVDALRDRAGEVLIGGVMEHVEEAGVHSGDSACAIPPPTLRPETIEVLEGYTRAIAAELGVVGPVNVQYAVQRGQVFVIEANPRASRTVPFVAKATGVPLAKLAAGDGRSHPRGTAWRRPASNAGLPKARSLLGKEAVLPFERFPDVDALLGPEMRSTGEVMGIASTFPLAFAKSQIAAGMGDAERRRGVLLSRRPGQGRRSARGAGLHGARFPHCRDRGHRCCAREGGCTGRGPRREAERDRRSRLGRGS